MERAPRALVAYLLLVISSFVCSASSSSSRALPSTFNFPVPDQYKMVTESSDPFFSVYNEIFPQEDGQVYYGLYSRATYKSGYTRSIYYQQQQDTTQLNTTAESPTLVLGTSFAAAGSKVVATYESTIKVDDIFTHLYLAPLDPQTNRLLRQPTEWVNPPIPEPEYSLNGTFLGDFVDNSSVVVEQGSSFGSYLARFSPDGQSLYLLVRTDFFGSLKLLKYRYNTNNNTLTFVWRQIIKPEIKGRYGVIPFGVGEMGFDQSQGTNPDSDLILLVEAEPQETATLQKYLKLPTGWSEENGGLLLRINEKTGAITQGSAIDLTAIMKPNRSPFGPQGRYDTTALLVYGPHVYVSLTGRLETNPIVVTNVLLRYEINNITATHLVRTAVPQIFINDVANSCRPATRSVRISSLAILQRTIDNVTFSELYIGGDAGYRQEPTGSVTAGGKAFIMTVNANELFSQGIETPVRVGYFGVPGRDNGISHMVATRNNVYMGLAYNRGLTHDPPDKTGQQAAILVTDHSVIILSCMVGFDWWLQCKNSNCLSWCFLSPFNATANQNKPFAQCTSPPPNDDDDDDDDGHLHGGAIAGIVIGASAGALIVILFIVAIFWARHKYINHKGYDQVGNDGDRSIGTVINDVLVKGLIGSKRGNE